MLLGIKPTVDFVFKKVFGSPESTPVLIGLLHAILKLAHPLVHVEILNPFRSSNGRFSFCFRTDTSRSGCGHCCREWSFSRRFPWSKRSRPKRRIG